VGCTSPHCHAATVRVMTSLKLGEDIIRLLLVTPRGSLWDTVRPMATSHDDALAIVGVSIVAQSAVDARLALSRSVINDRTRSREIELIVRDLMR
jgi:hypothetical protein